MANELEPGAEALVSEIRNYGAGRSSGKARAFLEAMGREHRTNQQNFTRLCVAWLEYCATADHDLRNEASCELGRVFVEFIEPGKRALPYI